MHEGDMMLARSNEHVPLGNTAENTQGTQHNIAQWWCHIDDIWDKITVPCSRTNKNGNENAMGSRVARSTMITGSCSSRCLDQWDLGEYHIVYADDMGISTVREPRLHPEGGRGVCFVFWGHETSSYHGVDLSCWWHHMNQWCHGISGTSTNVTLVDVEQLWSLNGTSVAAEASYTTKINSIVRNCIQKQIWDHKSKTPALVGKKS